MKLRLIWPHRQRIPLACLLALALVFISQSDLAALPESQTATKKSTYFPPPESQGGWRKLENTEAIRHLGGMDPQKLNVLRQWLLQSDDRNFAATGHSKNTSARLARRS